LWQESGENTGDFGSNISYLCRCYCKNMIKSAFIKMAVFGENRRI
jgi:hypothetical protein